MIQRGLGTTSQQRNSVSPVGPEASDLKTVAMPR